LWETWDVAKPIPKLNDPVVIEGKTGIFVVIGIDTVKKIANVRSAAGPYIVHQDVPWSAISSLDDSQNAARIVREATEFWRDDWTRFAPLAPEVP
jgi:hypothetical protein